MNQGSIQQNKLDPFYLQIKIIYGELKQNYRILRILKLQF